MLDSSMVMLEERFEKSQCERLENKAAQRGLMNDFLTQNDPSKAKRGRTRTRPLI